MRAWLVVFFVLPAAAGCITIQVPAPQCGPPEAAPSTAAPAMGAPAAITLDPSTWHRTGRDPGLYTWMKDESVLHGGGPTMRFQKSPGQNASVDAWAATIASLPAAEYAGLRVRFMADVKTENATEGASVWLRLDDASRPTAICNMINPVDHRLKGTHDFTTLSCVLDVPASTKTLVFGLLLSGSGTAWMGPATIGPVGHDVPESPHA